jgi:hypothetical protein
MKKLPVMMFLMLGTLSFASSGKIIKPMVMPKETVLPKETASVNDAAIYCCTITEIRYCGHLGENSCATLRRILGIQ